MRNTLLLLLLLVFVFVGGYNGCTKMSSEKKESEELIYDVIIVGGGMAGLTAGYNLRKEIGSQIKMLILEKDERLGGRIFDKEYNGIRYSLGAEFGYHYTMIPEELRHEYKTDKKNRYRGVFYNNELFLGNNTLDAQYSLLSKEERSNVDKYIKKEITINQLVERIRKLNDFYLIIESYEKIPLLEYRTDLGLSDFSLINYYGKYLSNEVRLSSNVISIVSGEKNIQIEYMKDGKTEYIKTEAVIVATPSDIAYRIIKGVPEKTASFLKSVRYNGAGLFVLIVENKKELLPFSYISVDNSPVFMVFQNVTGQGKYVSYNFYYSKDYFINNNENLLETSINIINNFGVVKLKNTDVVHTDKVIWENMVSVIPSELYHYYSSEEIFRPFPRVFIAGDYTMGSTRSSEMLPKIINSISQNDSVTKKEFIPYGVFQAWMSGVKASEDVKNFLDFKNREKK